MLDLFFLPVVLAGLLGGASTGLLGVQIVGMRIPFVGVCISHAAMAGAVFGQLLGVPPIPAGLLAAVLTSVLLGMVRFEEVHFDINVVMGVLFSLMMGLAFLGIGLSPGAKTPMLSLMWGSLVLVNYQDVLIIGGGAVLLVGFVVLFFDELKAILFSRMLARAGGIHEQGVWIGFLALAGLVVAVNLQTIGGLMLFSLLINPAAAASRLARGYRQLLVTSAGLGAASALGGFAAAYYMDLPAGACIVLTSTLILAGVVVVEKARK